MTSSINAKIYEAAEFKVQIHTIIQTSSYISHLPYQL